MSLSAVAHNHNGLPIRSYILEAIVCPMHKGYSPILQLVMPRMYMYIPVATYWGFLV